MENNYQTGPRENNQNPGRIRKYAGAVARNATLLPLEIGLKLSAIPSAVAATWQEGGLLQKMYGGVRDLVNVPKIAHDEYQNIVGLKEFKEEFTTHKLSPYEFLKKYTEKGIETAKETAETATEAGSQFMENFTTQPIATAIAVLGVLSGLYLAGEATNFARTKGQGGIITRAKRRLGKKVFKDVA
tara:strand:- start:4428 stop:4985 length:558 start_codon:yes stop_codon:yes gene_type:complete